MSAADNRQDVDTNVETCSQQMVTRYLPRGDTVQQPVTICQHRTGYTQI